MSDLVPLNAAFPIVDAQGRPTEPLRRLLLALIQAAGAAATAQALADVEAILTANGLTETSDHETRIAALEP